MIVFLILFFFPIPLRPLIYLSRMLVFSLTSSAKTLFQRSCHSREARVIHSSTHPLIPHTPIYIGLIYKEFEASPNFPSSPDHSNPSFLTSTFYPSLIILILLCLTPMPSSSCHHGRSFPSCHSYRPCVFFSICWGQSFLFHQLGSSCSDLPITVAPCRLFTKSDTCLCDIFGETA